MTDLVPAPTTLKLPDLDSHFAAELRRRADVRRKMDLVKRQELLAEPRSNLLGFTAHTNPRFVPGWFPERVCEKLDWFLEEVAMRRSPRLMILAPPRHGKSDAASRRFPAYALGRYPDLQIIGASYAMALAKRMSRDVQRIIDEPAYHELFPSTLLPGKGVKGHGYTRTNELFEIVGQRGGYRAAGVGVGITGMGGDIGIIDDPVKDARDAASSVYREGVWDWYTSTFYTRIEAGGGILLMLTRWHEDDLAGRLLKAMESGDGEQWEVMRFPALAEAGYTDPDDPRDEGEALHPARWPGARLERIKKTVGPYVWSALYQQRPSPREGTLFKPHLIEVVKAASLPPMTKVVRGWDLAGSRKKPGRSSGPDFTAGVKIGVGRDGTYYILDLVHMQETPAKVRETVKGVTSQDGTGVYIRLPQDPGQAGVDQKEQYAKALAGYMFQILPVSGDKEIRATPLASQVEVGNVKMVEAPWNAGLVEEMRTFPNGLHDDRIDAAADAFNELAGVVPGEGLLEYYRQEAEKAANAMGADPQALPKGDKVPLRGPPEVVLAFGIRGNSYRPDPAGIFWVAPDDVQMARQPGWVVLDPQDLVGAA